MRDLPHIRALYVEIDTELRRLRTSAIAVSDLGRAEQILSKQSINDQAYFLLCWGQLETAIDEKCRDAIRSRQKSGNWAIRRGWDLYNPDDPRLSGLRFEHRTALVLDRSGGKGSPWARLWSITQCGIKLPMENCWRGELTWPRLYKTCSRFRLRFKHRIKVPGMFSFLGRPGRPHAPPAAMN